MNVLDLAGWVAASVIPDSEPLPEASLDHGSFAELMAIMGSERTIAQLGAAADRGLVALSEAQSRELAHAHEQAMRSCVLLERSLGLVGEWLDAAGVPFRVLKGPAVARLDYADPSWRAFGDLDLLVPDEHYDAALAVLHDHGGTRRYAEARPGFDRRFGKGSCVVLPDATEIDLHRTLAAGAFGLTIPLHELFESPAVLRIGGKQYEGLSRHHRFLHACYHAALGDAVPRLATLSDIALMASTPLLDVDDVVARARRWRGEAVVAHAVKLTWLRLGLAPSKLSLWAFAHDADRYQARALTAYLGFGRSYARQAMSGVSALHSPTEKVAYVRTLLVPQRGYVQDRDGSYTLRLRRAVQVFNESRRAR
jgi:Uncharacterised nucleotidyltransferase